LIPITKYRKYDTFVPPMNLTLPSCDTEANQIWSRTYLILILVLTYLITGIFLIIIYGQVIQLMLASKKFTDNKNALSSCALHQAEQHLPGSSSSTNSNQRDSTKGYVSTIIKHHRTRKYTLMLTSTQRTSLISANNYSNSLTRLHTQRLQVIITLFIVIVLYIILLLPYRVFNLLFILHNQIFDNVNELVFQRLINVVRLLVFLNCALQPITYLVISSRLRQSVIKLLKLYFKCKCTDHNHNKDSVVDVCVQQYQLQPDRRKRFYCDRYTIPRTFTQQQQRLRTTSSQKKMRTK
ncbi:unnamed protein product, partial [Didymodactylos carnosus]